MIGETPIHAKHDLAENLWGYAKRLRFVRQAIADYFPDRTRDSITILDVGCGNGSQLALPLLHDGYDVTGIDPDASSVAKAKEISCHLSQATFLYGTVNDLPATHMFDVVILGEVLEHVWEPQQLLCGALSKLKSDGLVIVSTPNGFGEFELDSWLYRTLHLKATLEILKRLLGCANGHRNWRGDSDGEPNHESPVSSTENSTCGHVQFFTLNRIYRLFESCSLSVVRKEGSSLIAGPIACLTLGRSRAFIDWNARITGRLPLWMASGWLFSLRRSD